MAAICEFYRYTPEEVWDLDLPDYYALVRRMNKRAEDEER